MAPVIHLGINTCFAVKRWPEPVRWSSLVRDELGLQHCQLTLDLVEPDLGSPAARLYAESAGEACRDAGVQVHSTFTGLAAYSSSLLLHPQPAMRDAATEWFEAAVELSAVAGARGTGGFLGALSVADASDPSRRAGLLAELGPRLVRIGRRAAESGLDLLLMENMAVEREPGARIEEAHELEAMTAESPVPWALCLDVGHPCALRTGTSSDEYRAWLAEDWSETPVLQVQQANRQGDFHWPFTSEHNRRGLVDAAAVVAALRRWQASEVFVFLEVIHPHEAEDQGVLDDLRQSVEHWREALEQ